MLLIHTRLHPVLMDIDRGPLLGRMAVIRLWQMVRLLTPTGQSHSCTVQDPRMLLIRGTLCLGHHET